MNNSGNDIPLLIRQGVKTAVKQLPEEDFSGFLTKAMDFIARAYVTLEKIQSDEPLMVQPEPQPQPEQVTSGQRKKLKSA
jgi:hypothetical protein